MRVGEMELEDREVARVMGALRLGVGVAMFVAPNKVAKSWTGDGTESLPSTLALRGMAARDIAIGLGLVKAVELGTPTRGWLEAGAFSDAGDALATLMAWRELGGVRRLFWLAAEAGAAVVQIQLAEALDD
jgi:hypothetical protein